MATTPASFRQQYNAFGLSDPNIYSDATINLWIGVAANMLDANRWGALYDYGVGLWVAHRLVMIQRDILAAQAGGIPGDLRGVLSSKSVDKVSTSYDVSRLTLDNGGELNSSRYGVEFLRMSRLMGAGGMQVGAC